VRLEAKRDQSLVDIVLYPHVILHAGVAELTERVDDTASARRRK